MIHSLRAVQCLYMYDGYFFRPQGLVFSKGQFNSPNCVYVKPYTGVGAYTFDIYYNKCGTKPDLNGKFYENTIIVQYDNELIEVCTSN